MRPLRAPAVLLGTLALTTACITSASSAAPRPDLVVTAVNWAPTGIAPGQAVTFSATIKNAGTGATPDGVKHGVQFKVDGVMKTWSDDRVTSLYPGASVTVTANGGPSGSTWPAVAGTHIVTAEVDDARRIVESNESNNKLNSNVDVSAALASRLRVTSQGVTVTSSVKAHPRATGLASSLTGAAFAACINPDGSQVPNSERYIGDFVIGNSTYSPGAGSWGSDGLAEVPAGTTALQVRSSAMSTGPIKKWNYGDVLVISCPAGANPDWTRFHTKQLRTNRYELTTAWQAGPLVASTTAPVDIDLDMAW